MQDTLELSQSSSVISNIIGAPFAWCAIPGGGVELADASQEGGTKGGQYTVADFWMAKYPVTNAQYQAFLDAPDGFCNAQWWEFSPQAQQWHADHPRPKPTAFVGQNLPRTRVSWFDSMAFCAWLSEKWQASQSLPGLIRLPTEQEWQRAALGDSGWAYPWGNEIDSSRANYGNRIGQPTPVDRYTEGQSVYGVMDLIGNLNERCITAWGTETTDLSGYTYRVMRGGAWNIRNVEYLRADSRYGHPPRGQLNDAGFRFVLVV